MLSCGEVVYVFCFRQKTAYEMRISDWSSDVCSSDLEEFDHFLGNQLGAVVEHQCPVKIPGVVDAVLDLIAIAVKLALFGAIALNIAIYQAGHPSCRERVCRYV